MTVEMVLNDLSIPSPVNEIGYARKLMTDLVDVLGTAIFYGAKKALRSEGSLYSIDLSYNYPIAAWLNDDQVDIDDRRLLRSFEINSPLLAQISDSRIHDQKALSDFSCQDETAYALGISYLLNSIAISFCSDPKWNYDSLELKIVSLNDSTEEFTTKFESIIHASKGQHIRQNKEKIKARILALPWHNQDDLLPCYTEANGDKPLVSWIDSLGDLLAKEIIQSRLTQCKQGNLGNYKSVGDGLIELKIFYGPGYRVYCGKIGIDKYLLLNGGDKSTQSQDIVNAKRYWQDYKQKENVV
ncbi:type II toxin-antitoxin system RelE/ParE family toxin [Pseudanabaena sp. UWO310]|uniref:type II toxin-antitoxin system RelE/ParE family toxin n=1 Tax=Pseudanabaena sp. UWO310 TaxID=2480795 RepID=UPI001CC1EDD0|nr:type II toxin-antitoxin system RelE/ParE family toxin [Pseudanabaena sp. UWO310]